MYWIGRNHSTVTTHLNAGSWSCLKFQTSGSRGKFDTWVVTSHGARPPQSLCRIERRRSSRGRVEQGEPRLRGSAGPNLLYLIGELTSVRRTADPIIPTEDSYRVEPQRDNVYYMLVDVALMTLLWRFSFQRLLEEFILTLWTAFPSFLWGVMELSLVSSLASLAFINRH